MHIVYLSLGTNLGDKEHNLLRAIKEIGKRIGPVKAQSAFLHTEPWGFVSENSFINCAIKVSTRLSPLQVLRRSQHIERTMGRKRKSTDGQYHDRIIDIDILLFYDKERSGESIQFSSPQLTIPHPLMNERDFVRIPLSEIL